MINLGDGIFDKLTTKEVVDIVWNSTKENLGDNIHQVCATAVEQIMKTAIGKRTVDNITVVMIAFSSFKNFLFPKKPELIGHNSLDNIDVGRKQYILDNSLTGNNSFDLDNRSFSLGEELNIVNVDPNNNIIDINANGLNKNNVSTNSKTLIGKRNNILKKKSNIVVAGASTKPLVSNSTNAAFIPFEKGKTYIGNNNGGHVSKIQTHKTNLINSSAGVKKFDAVHTSRGLTKNIETFYKKK